MSAACSHALSALNELPDGLEVAGVRLPKQRLRTRAQQHDLHVRLEPMESFKVGAVRQSLRALIIGVLIKTYVASLLVVDDQELRQVDLPSGLWRGAAREEVPQSRPAVSPVDCGRSIPVSCALPGRGAWSSRHPARWVVHQHRRDRLACERAGQSRSRRQPATHVTSSPASSLALPGRRQKRLDADVHIQVRPVEGTTAFGPWPWLRPTRRGLMRFGDCLPAEPARGLATGGPVSRGALKDSREGVRR